MNYFSLDIDPYSDLGYYMPEYYTDERDARRAALAAMREEREEEARLQREAEEAEREEEARLQREAEEAEERRLAEEEAIKREAIRSILSRGYQPAAASRRPIRKTRKRKRRVLPKNFLSRHLEGISNNGGSRKTRRKSRGKTRRIKK